MRAISVITSVMDDLMWMLTVIAFGILLFATPVATAPMPLFGGTVQQFLLDWRFEAVMVLVAFSMLSGRWPTQGMRTFDRRFVLACALVLLAFCALAFAGRDIMRGNEIVRADLPLGVRKDLLVITAFAWISWGALKAESFLATSRRSGVVGEPATVASGDELGAKVTGGKDWEIGIGLRADYIRVPGGPKYPLPLSPPVIEHSPSG